MAYIKIQKNSEEINISADAGTLVSDILKSAAVPFSMPCGGNHSCGKCKVEIDGTASPMDEKERKLLGSEANGKTRLACFTKILGDCTITLPDRQKNAAVEIENGSLKAKSNEKCALVFDIGTTTVAGSVYGLEPFRLLCSEGHLSSQRPFGADVVSRIDYCCKNGTEKITGAITQQLSSMAESLCKKAEASKENILRIGVTGNTTMLHIFAGLNPDTMAASPFTPRSLFGTEEKADKYLRDFPNAQLIFPPCIGPFLGADIVCAIKASSMTEKEENSFIADIGTNGEMALFADGKLYCCSTAAGPAFEGAGIEMGMPACDGAADKFYIENGEIKYHTIGEKEAIGICGTGLISAAALMLKTGIMDETGYICEEGHPFTHLIDYDDSGISYVNFGKIRITQRDIRQLQLAKGAISAGILTLLKECNMTPDKISSFYLCGGFGSYINPEDAAAIGLIPDAFKKVTHPLGNAAAKGAAITVKDENQESLKEIALSAKEISLSENAFFMEKYIDAMNFEVV